MVVLGTVLVALIIGLLIWLFIAGSLTFAVALRGPKGSPAKKVSFTKAAKQGQFRMLGDEDQETFGARIAVPRPCREQDSESTQARTSLRSDVFAAFWSATLCEG